MAAYGELFMATVKHRGEQLTKRPLMPPAELRDRRMVGHHHRRNQLVHHILPTRPLDPARRPIPTRIRVQKQRNQMSSTGRRNAV